MLVDKGLRKSAINALVQASQHYAWKGEWTESILYGDMHGHGYFTDYYLSVNSSNPQPTELGDFRAQYPLTPAESFRVVLLDPESSTLTLLGAGVMSLLAYAWRRRTV